MGVYECKYCEKEFRGYFGRKFCSVKCYYRSLRKRGDVTCLQCGKYFWVHQYRNNAKYCCEKCYGLSKRISKPKLICKTCGKEINTHRLSRINRQDRKYCSQNCYTIGRVKNKPIIMRNNKYPAIWHSLRKEIYKRDNWICVECGVHCSNKFVGDKHKIQCHHIDYNTENNNKNNLITLCSVCHSKTNFNRDNWTKHYNLKLIGE